MRIGRAAFLARARRAAPLDSPSFLRFKIKGVCKRSLRRTDCHV